MPEEKDLATVAGKGLRISLKGKQYDLSVLTLDDLAEFQKYIKSERLAVFMEAASGLDSKTKAETMTGIVSTSLTAEDIMKEIRSMIGTRYFLWKSLIKKQPGLELEEMGKLVDLDNFEEITAVVGSIGGKALKKVKEETEKKAAKGKAEK